MFFILLCKRSHTTAKHWTLLKHIYYLVKKEACSSCQKGIYTTVLKMMEENYCTHLTGMSQDHLLKKHIAINRAYYSQLHTISSGREIPVFQNSIFTDVECRGVPLLFVANTGQRRFDLVSDTVHFVGVYFILPCFFQYCNAWHPLNAAALVQVNCLCHVFNSLT